VFSERVINLKSLKQGDYYTVHPGRIEIREYFYMLLVLVPLVEYTNLERQMGKEWQ
jgi:hypothetical protein